MIDGRLGENNSRISIPRGKPFMLDAVDGKGIRYDDRFFRIACLVGIMTNFVRKRSGEL